MLLSCPFAMNLIDETLIKKTPTVVLRHCLTASLRVWGPPMFTNLNLSTCHCVRDGLLCYVTDIRENTKPNVLSSKGARRGEMASGREEEVWDHGVRLTLLIHCPVSQCAAWIYKLEHTC